MLAWPWGLPARRRRLASALTTTVLASTTVPWRGAPLAHSKDLLADARAAHPGYARLCEALRRDFERLAKQAQLPAAHQLQALQAATDLLGRHGLTSHELSITPHAQQAADIVLTRAAASLAGEPLDPPTAGLCQQLVHAGYQQLLSHPDWIRRRRPT